MASGDVTQRERLAICCGLDVCYLAKLMAEYKLKIGDILHAKQLLSLAKVGQTASCIGKGRSRFESGTVGLETQIH